MRRRAAAACLVWLALAAVAELHAQSPSPGPWVPIGSRLDRLTLWVIADGGLSTVDALTRPFRLAALRNAAQKQDTTVLAAAGRQAFRWLMAELEGVADSTAIVAEFGGEAWRNGRRDSFRGGGSAGSGPEGGIWLGLTRGPFVGVFNPAFDNRLKDDPEFTGKKDRAIAGRLQSGYVALTGERGDLIFGRMSHAWGPDLFDGLQVSPSAYASDMLEGTLREGRFALTTMAQRLDDDDTTLSVPVNRYFFAHRLSVRLASRTWLAVTETGIYGGPGRGFEPAFLSPVNPAVLSEFNEGKSVDVLWGAAMHAPLGRRISFDGELMVDDIQIERDTLTGHTRPWSGGYTAVLRGSLPGLPIHAAAGYTMVRSLTYRNSFDPGDTYDLIGVGLARNFSDYDQALVRLEMWASPRILVGMDVSYLRQGSGDFRNPFPADSVLALPGQGFLVAPVQHSAAVRATMTLEPRNGVAMTGELGARQRPGGTSAIAGIQITLRFDALHHHWGAAFPAVEGTAVR